MRTLMQKTCLSTCLIGVLLLTVAGCVGARSVHPLSDPAKSKVDERLLGVWKHVEDNGNTTLLLIAKGELNDFNAEWKGRYPTGGMQFQFLGGWKADHTIAFKKEDDAGDFFPTELGKEWYANLLEPSAGALEGKQNRPPRFGFLSYEVRGDELRIYLYDDDALRKAIEAKEIAGEIIKLKKQDVRPKPGVKNIDFLIEITDTTQNLQKFLKNGGAAKIFPRNKKNTLLYRRMK